MTEHGARVTLPRLRWALLYIRDALAVPVAPSIPACDPPPAAGVAKRPWQPGDARELRELWQSVAGGVPPSAESLARLDVLTHAVERAALQGWIDDRTAWAESMVGAPDAPEHVLASELARAGIGEIVLLPVAGSYLDRHYGVVVASFGTYADVSRLGAFLTPAA